MSDRLLSGKQIVGVSLFLLIGLLYLTTGFVPDTGKFEVPDFLKDPCAEYSEDTIDLCKNARSFDEIFTNGLFQMTPSSDSFKSKTKIDRMSCDDLVKKYHANSEWSLRDYVAYRYVNTC